MIKYLRERITGRPAILSTIDDDDLPFNENLLAMKKTHSQPSLTDVMSINMNLNFNNDQPINQLEKLTNSAGGNRLNGSSSSIIIPQKPICSNASSSLQSSSSYTSLGDQMSSIGEILFQSNRDSDNVGYTSLPMLPLDSQRLEHTAARDRILVKKKRQQQQPIKDNKLSVLKETDDNQNNLLVFKPDDEQEEIVETKSSPQSLVNLSDLDTARSNLRVSIRPRDHSADHILSPTPVVPTYISAIQRSASFKRPEEINETTVTNRSIFTTEKPKEEHIYDNFDVFKQENQLVRSREHSTGRLRPVTMHVPSNNNTDKQTISEFENVFNQLKKRATVKKEETVSVSEEPVQSPPIPSATMEETPMKLVTENEPIAPVMIATSKITVTSSVSQSPNRRKTVGGVHLPGNNKVAVDDNKPTPSWIDIAKQKQNKFQSPSSDKDHHNDLEQQQPTPPIEPEIIPKKPQMINSSDTAIVKENNTEETLSNRKSAYEPVIARRKSPPLTHGIERDSIRALKAANPNRINNLIQLFDK